MKNVLIVGGAGYIGGAITDALSKENDYNTRVYDCLLYEDLYLKPIDFFCGDIQNRRKLKEHLDWADIVIWLAAIVGDGACALNPQLTKEINEDSVKFLAENFDGRIIFMSTCSVYGMNDSILTEESKTNPLSVYASTKLSAEKYLKDKDAIIFRLGTLCGKGDNYSRIRLDLVLNVLVARAYAYGKLSVFGGEQYRPLLDVKDVANAIILNLETQHRGIYNLANENIRIADLAKQVNAAFNETLTIEFTEMKFEDLRNYKVNSQKAVETFGFAPQYDINYSINELKNLFESSRIKNISESRFSNHLYLKEVDVYE